MEVTFISAFFVGLFSTLHCLGMCGGIVGALTFSLPEHIRTNRWRLLPYISAYNTGRITSYSVAGALAGGLGENIIALLPQYGHMALQLFATLLMIGIGLYLAGWFPHFARIEQLGKPIWKKLEPISQKLIPVKSPLQAWLFGLVWGWLPCGLVYTALIWSTTASSAKDGALFMLAFGAGTLPTVMTAGILTGWFVRLSRSTYIRPVVGISVIILALITGYLGWQHGSLPQLNHLTH
jgi:sulfite exporter TauE/SafE